MLKHDLIAGERTAGIPSPNIDPSDTDDVIGRYHRPEPAEAQRTIDMARHVPFGGSSHDPRQRGVYTAVKTSYVRP